MSQRVTEGRYMTLPKTLGVTHYQIAYSSLDNGFLLKCFTLVSRTHIHADNSVSREAGNCFDFLSTFIPCLPPPIIGQILVGETARYSQAEVSDAA